MMDPTFTILFDILTGMAWIAPIVVLAVLAVVDLRAVMLVRAVTLLAQRARSGEARTSREEWAPAIELH